MLHGDVRPKKEECIDLSLEPPSPLQSTSARPQDVRRRCLEYEVGLLELLATLDYYSLIVVGDTLLLLIKLN